MSEEIPRQVLILTRLAQLELELRQAESREVLGFIAVNDLHRVVPFDHAALWRADLGRITAVSGGLKVEATAPEIVGLGAIAAALCQPQPEGCQPRRIDQKQLQGRLGEVAGRFLFGDSILVPLARPGSTLEGALVLLRASPFSDGELRVLGRLGSAIGTALAAWRAPQLQSAKRQRRRLVIVAMLAAGLALLMVPVPMTILAEATVVPIEPMVVAAPLDGVIAAVLAQPNQALAKGALLLTFDRTELAAQRDVQAKRVRVLEAEHARTEQQAFLDERARAELGLTLARLEEGRAELRLAADRLARAEVHAPGAGIAVIEGRSSWIGRPVRVGEKILSIADPGRARLEIRIAVEDVLVVAPGAAVDLFLAIAPSRPVQAILTSVSYDVRQVAGAMPAFIGEAELVDSTSVPRLGLTGTARITGGRAPLGYFLLRKPLASLRRLLGV